MWAQTRSGQSEPEAAGRGAAAWPPGRAWAIPVIVALVAILARIPALGTWWCLDDWGQLARAAGRLETPPGLPARWLSQQAWWSLTWPLFGLNAAAHAWLRILLHALAAVMVVRIARRAGLAPLAQLVAGLLFAVTPVAFTPLYWASGIQELLGGVLALLAVERWLADGRLSVLAAGLAATGSILAKESALALPVLLLATLVPRRAGVGGNARLRWAVAVLVAAVALGEGALVLSHFARGTHDPYALGGPLVMLGNLGKFGWWLPTPGPTFTAQVDWTRAGCGIALLLAWGGYGAWAWRRGRRLPLTAWACALLSLGPALPLVNQARPYMGYLAAAAGSLTLASLVPSLWRPRVPVVAALVVSALVWGQFAMRGRLSGRAADGLPTDPVVRAAQIARRAASEIRELLPVDFDQRHCDLFIYQAQLTTRAGGAGKSAMPTPQYVALGGPLGAGLLLGTSGNVEWTNFLLGAPPSACVLCEKSRGFQAWGSTPDALLYAAELHVVAGNHEQALAHLLRAAELDPARELQVPAPDVLGIPRAALQGRAAEFHRWLESMAMSDRLSGEDHARCRRFLAAREQTQAHAGRQ